ncbi:MAG TPA: hypothetical protein DHW38_07880 [Planctomycetaceae bacterium]|jgi:hypothetical protein|nr:hypothetical protein [Pirellulales bacterium]HCK71482.1 hypothetical protein [Planctomycetaceae bacterium]HCP85691.1 hypothetical protein [Planctomycetaceae bacterium]|tara:strand:- start:2428 stop:2703 length:276 start_codon:yes stop_codon:yes gene_type:complete
MQENVWNGVVRERIWDFFLQHQPELDETVEESLLISDGHFLGQRFRCAQMEAVWLVEENVIKLHASNGSIESIDVDTLENPAAQEASKRAA